MLEPGWRLDADERHFIRLEPMNSFERQLNGGRRAHELVKVSLEGDQLFRVEWLFQRDVGIELEGRVDTGCLGYLKLEAADGVMDFVRKEDRKAELHRGAAYWNTIL